MNAPLTTLADRCREAARVDAIGVMLVTATTQLEVIAWSSEAQPYAAVFELQIRQGPCLDSYRTNRAVAIDDLASPETTRRWPLFAPAAARAGLRGADAVPMRVGHRVVGGLSLLRCHPTPLDPQTLSTVQGLADLTTSAVLRSHTGHRPSLALGQHPSSALDARMVIEQANGMVAERSNLSIEQARAHLRDRALLEGRPLADLASDIVNGTPRSTPNRRRTTQIQR